MDDFVTESTKLTDAIAEYWESKLAPLYSSASLRVRERKELGDLKAHLKSKNLEAVRQIVTKWYQYHDSQGEFADSLMIGVRHSNLANRCRALLELLSSIE